MTLHNAEIALGQRGPGFDFLYQLHDNQLPPHIGMFVCCVRMCTFCKASFGIDMVPEGHLRHVGDVPLLPRVSVYVLYTITICKIFPPSLRTNCSRSAKGTASQHIRLKLVTRYGS